MFSKGLFLLVLVNDYCKRMTCLERSPDYGALLWLVEDPQIMSSNDRIINRDIKWNGPLWFGPTEYLKPALKVVHFVWLGYLVSRTEMPLSIGQNWCPQYRSFVSCLQDQ